MMPAIPTPRIPRALPAALALLLSSCPGRSDGLDFVFNAPGGTPPEVVAGFEAAGRLWSAWLQENLTVTVEVRYQTVAGGALSDVVPALVNVSYSSYRASLLGDRVSPFDTSATGTLPAATGVAVLISRTFDSPWGAGSSFVYIDNDGGFNNSNIRMTRATFRAAGGSAAAGSDGTVTLNSSPANPWDFDRSDGIAAGQRDFVGAAARVLGNVLGFVSEVDRIDALTPGTFTENDTSIAPLDLFRYSETSAGSNLIDMAADTREKYFSLNVGADSVAAFSTGVNFGDGAPASSWERGSGTGLMDPTLELGRYGRISILDLVALDVIGWNVNYIQPDIRVRGGAGAEDIADGSTSPSADNGTDFGPVPLDAPAVERTFTVTNTGGLETFGNLVLGGDGGAPAVEVIGPQAAEFSLANTPASPLAPDASTTFTVRFAPAAQGARSARVVIASNDPDEESAFEFSITGTGTEPLTPTFTLGSAAYAVDEGAGSVAVEVRKLGVRAAAINYATANGSAVSTSGGIGDYDSRAGSLSFGAGAGAQVVTIPVVDDGIFEGEQSFTFALSSPTNGGNLGQPHTATITINDNDTAGETLSFTDNAFPSAPPPAGGRGSLRVDLLPAGVAAAGGWRFPGEPAFRASGTSAAGLEPGNWTVEFKPVPGFYRPVDLNVPVDAGATAVGEGHYIAADAGAGAVPAGSLTVRVEPPGVAAAPALIDRGQWRLQGEGDGAWRDGGATLDDLPAGPYVIEFKGVPGRALPRLLAATVVAGQGNAVTGTYFIEHPPAGNTPSPLPFETITTGLDLPYAYGGQVRTPLGFGSGFAVRERVVLTAAHVLFDDAELTYGGGVRWLFQRHSGTFEPAPLEPRGFYVFDGYAAQREADDSPGTSTPASQQLDAAALFFLAPAARGGAGGYLASDAENNEWLLSGRDKLLLGYPMEGVPEANRGRTHATFPFNVTFAHATGRRFTTADIAGFPGASGGPLCVRWDNGNFYPAGIYLGGSAQAVVRAIDGEVVELIERAVTSGEGGPNNNSGGIVAPALPGNPAAAAPGFLGVDLTPAAAGSAGAGWRLAGGPPAYLPGGGGPVALFAGTYTVEFAPAEGFVPPASATLEIVAGQTTTRSFDYRPAERFAQWPPLANLPAGQRNPGDDPDGDGRSNLVEFFLGSDPADPRPPNASQLTQATAGPGGEVRVRLRVAHRRAVAGLSFVIESSENLVDWTPVAAGAGQGSVVETSPDGAMETREAEVELGGPGRRVFLRVRVVEQP